jgi:hypothetical protein
MNKYVVFEQGNVNIFGNNKLTKNYLIRGFRKKLIGLNSPVVHFSIRSYITDQTTTTEIWYIRILLHKTKCFGCPDHPSSGRCLMHKMNIKGERPIFTVVKIVTLLRYKLNNKVHFNAKLLHRIPYL